MEPKRSKYDTNPLDEDVAERATRAWGGDTGSPPDSPTQNVGRAAATRDIGRSANEAARQNPETEAPTRRIDDSYPSVFAYGQPQQTTYQSPYQSPQPMANIYQPPPVPPPNIYQRPPEMFAQPSDARKVAGLNISERWANVLPYCPFYIGLVAAIVELLLVPRSEPRTRFHAAQGFSLHIAILLIGSVFGVIRTITDSGVGSGLFGFAAFVFLIVSIVRVWKGKPHHIALLDGATKWVEEKIIKRS
jgi:uncharacterized membrane protein